MARPRTPVPDSPSHRRLRATRKRVTALASARSIRIPLAALALVTLSGLARGEPEFPDGFYEQSQSLVLKHMRELAAAVVALAPESAVVDNRREYRLAGLRGVDKRYPRGMPITSEGHTTARLVRLVYKDSPPAGLSRGDELEFQLQKTSNGGYCLTRYWFYWEPSGPLGVGSLGTACSSPARAQPGETDAGSLFDTFGSDKDLVQFLIQREIELAHPRPSRGKSPQH